MDKVYICPLSQKPCFPECSWNTYGDTVGYGCCALFKIYRALEDIERRIK
jgi:hypothetical protein